MGCRRGSSLTYFELNTDWRCQGIWVLFIYLLILVILLPEYSLYLFHPHLNIDQIRTKSKKFDWLYGGNEEQRWFPVGFLLRRHGPSPSEQGHQGALAMLFNYGHCKLYKNPFVLGRRWGRALWLEDRKIKWFEIRTSLLTGSPVVHLRSSITPWHTSTHVALRCTHLWTTTSPVCGVCRTISLRLTGLQSQRLRGFGKKSFFFHKHWKISWGSGDFGFH